MQRSLKTLPLVALAAALVFAAVASARNINVGGAKTKLSAPVCTGNNTTLYELAHSCPIVLYWNTAIPSMSDRVAYPTTVTRPGKITSFTVGISQITPIASLRKTAVGDATSSYGGPPELRLTVLRAVGSPGSVSWRVVAQSGVWYLAKDLGKVLKMTLRTPIPVVKGDVLAITAPTWAPILSYWKSGDPVNFEYRASFSSNCSRPSLTLTSKANVQSTIGEFAKYGCQYVQRPEFTANEVPSG